MNLISTTSSKFPYIIEIILSYSMYLLYTLLVYAITVVGTDQAMRLRSESDASPKSGKLKRSDSKKSFSGLISKMMKQNKAAKLWKLETDKTRENFHPTGYSIGTDSPTKNPKKFHKSRSLPGGHKSFKELLTSSKRKSAQSLSISPTDLGYESSEQLCNSCDRRGSSSSGSSSEEDNCSKCRIPITYRSSTKLHIFYHRSLSAPGMLGADLSKVRQKKANTHWQWYLRGTSSSWQSFNTDKKYCY